MMFKRLISQKNGKKIKSILNCMQMKQKEATKIITIINLICNKPSAFLGIFSRSFKTKNDQYTNAFHKFTLTFNASNGTKTEAKKDAFEH